MRIWIGILRVQMWWWFFIGVFRESRILNVYWFKCNGYFCADILYRPWFIHLNTVSTVKARVLIAREMPKLKPLFRTYSKWMPLCGYLCFTKLTAVSPGKLGVRCWSWGQHSLDFGMLICLNLWYSVLWTCVRSWIYIFSICGSCGTYSAPDLSLKFVSLILENDFWFVVVVRWSWYCDGLLPLCTEDVYK